MLTFKIEQYELRKLWVLHSAHAKEKSMYMRNLLILSSNLRMNILSFLDSLINYWSIDVIENHWKRMIEGLEEAKEF